MRFGVRSMLVVLIGLGLARGGADPRSGASAAKPGPPARPGTITGRFTPPEGQALLIVGQDLGAVAGYVANVHSTPGGVTTYTSLWGLGGLQGPANWGSGDVDGQATLEAYPESALAIGLHLVESTGDELNRLVDGAYDEQIDRLGRFIRAADRPVYLRIGYEFDGPWNHYPPAEFVPAWRYLVDRLRSAGVGNVATVWQSAANVTFEDRPFSEWWPGDDYVDWIGTSFFLVDENLDRHGPLIDWAESRDKPLMICEAAPRGYDVDGLTFSRDGASFAARTPEEIWAEWYAPFFELVRTHAHAIRAVAYINVEWSAQEMWSSGSSGYWGDSRIEANVFLRERWLAQINDGSWRNGGPDLFDRLAPATSRWCRDAGPGVTQSPSEPWTWRTR